MKTRIHASRLLRTCIAAGALFGALALAAVPGTAGAATADGTLDTTFNAGGTGANGTIHDVAFTSDEMIYIAGQFTTYNGFTVGGLARLNPNGAPDLTFNQGGTGFTNSSGTMQVNSIAVAADGDIYVAGAFTSYNGTALAHPNEIIRLNPDGSIDGGFAAPKLKRNSLPNSNIMPNVIRIINNVVLVSGPFDDVYSPSNAANATHQAGGIVGLTATGAIDTGFSGGSSLLNLRLEASSAPTGARDIRPIPGSTDMIMRGQFRRADTPTLTPYMARIKSDGTVSPTFNRNGNPPTVGTDSDVEAIAIQSDGKVLIGGVFATLDGAARKGIARLGSDGAVDESFSSPTSPIAAYSIEVDTNGRIYVAGFLNTAYATTNTKFARLKSDGTVDTTFDLSATPDNGNIEVALSPAGKVFVYGQLTKYGDTSVGRIARINASAPSSSSSDSTPAAGGSSVTPTTVAGPNVGTVTPPPVPGQPGNIRVSVNRTRATVSWDAPTTGGSPTSYTAIAIPAGPRTSGVRVASTLSCTVNAPATSCVIAGLESGRKYGFSVSAANETGGSLSASTPEPVAVPVAKVKKSESLPETGTDSSMWLLVSATALLLLGGVAMRRTRLS